MELAVVVKQQIEEFVNDLNAKHPAFEKARKGEIGPCAIAQYLMSLRYVMRCSPQHMSLAARRADEMLMPELASYLRRKQIEETGHDLWADSDLRELSGWFAQEFDSHPAPTVIALMEFVEAESGRDPRMYVVYALFAEYMTVLAGAPWIQLLTDRCGIPKNALTVVAKHVAADAAHADEGFSVAAEFLADPQVAGPSLAFLRESMGQFEDFMREIAATQG